VGAELYSHAGDDGTDFDAFENVNQLDDFPQVVRVRVTVRVRVG